MTLAPIRTPARLRIRVEGTVQGVGFRPYVYRLAQQTGLGGFVLNDARGVLIEIEGDPGAVDEFTARLEPEAPPLAVLEAVNVEELIPGGARDGFEIRPSRHGEVAQAPVTPDTATCADCLRELFDPANRRFRYPFINCTNCGPRFTIVTDIPYDRPLTTMAGFVMCTACRAEYEDPADRRFHAQPNACPECGPALRLHDRDGTPVAGDALALAATALREGAIVAVKGIGGFHLACRADDERAVAELRRRKHREHRPFALMVASLERAAALVELNARARQLLAGAERPIVLAPSRPAAGVAAGVAPASRELGLMLPYSPLHHLLLADTGVSLVMTSGNVSDEPIAYRDEDALARLRAIADLFLLHDRPIQVRTDDSVVRVLSHPAARGSVLRRSRGYVPSSLPLPGAGTPRPLLACGAQLKSTFCLAKGRRAWVSHHIGDLANYETLRSFGEGIEHLKRLFAVEPEVVVHDLHPEYLSTKYALEQAGVELVAVQHHHAHLAACLAEHDEPGPAIGAIFDGSGYGIDGTVWGGELLVGDLEAFRRVGGLRQVRLPGGEQAVREPWRMACAWLTLAGDGSPELPASLAGRVPEGRWRQVAELARRGVASPLTSSMGRLFDAVAALCGICAYASYEGQAAIELEAACRPGDSGAYRIGCVARGEEVVIDPRGALHEVIADLARGEPAGAVAGRFHAAVAEATVSACAQAAATTGIELVVLSGGVFQNRRLLEASLAGIQRVGLRALTPERLPANDGGISFGQAAVAARRLEGRR